MNNKKNFTQKSNDFANIGKMAHDGNLEIQDAEIINEDQTDKNEEVIVGGEESKKEINPKVFEKVAGTALDVSYKTYTSIVGIKFLTDLGLCAVAATGKIGAKLFNNEKIEKNTFFDIAKKNDLYQYLRDSFGSHGAGQGRKEIKDLLFKDGLSDGEEKVADKLAAIEEKLQKKDNWTEAQKQEYIAKVKSVLEKAQGKDKESKQLSADHLNQLTEAYLKNKVSMLVVAKDAMNFGLSAVGFQALRAAAYAGSAASQRIEKASDNYDKSYSPDDNQEDKPSRFKYIVKDLCIGSVKDTLRELTFSDKEGEKSSKLQKTLGFIRGIGTITRAIGISNIGLQDYLDSADLNGGVSSLTNTEGHINIQSHIAKDGLSGFAEGATENIVNNFYKSLDFQGLIKGYQDRVRDMLSDSNAGDIQTAVKIEMPVESEEWLKNNGVGSSAPADSIQEWHVASDSNHVAANENLIGDKQVSGLETEPDISSNDDGDKAFRDYIAANKIIASNPDIKNSLADVEIKQIATIEKGQGISAALDRHMTGKELVSFVQPNGTVVEAQAGAIFIHPGDKVIETETGAIYVIKDSDIKGVNVEDWNKAHNIDKAEVVADKPLISADAEHSVDTETTDAEVTASDAEASAENNTIISAVETGNDVEATEEVDVNNNEDQDEEYEEEEDDVVEVVENKKVLNDVETFKLHKMQTEEAAANLGFRDREFSYSDRGLVDVNENGYEYVVDTEQKLFFYRDNAGILHDMPITVKAEVNLKEYIHSEIDKSNQEIEESIKLVEEEESGKNSKETDETAENNAKDDKDDKDSGPSIWKRIFGKKGVKKSS